MGETAALLKIRLVKEIQTLIEKTGKDGLNVKVWSNRLALANGLKLRTVLDLFVMLQDAEIIYLTDDGLAKMCVDGAEMLDRLYPEQEVVLTAEEEALLK